MLLEKSFLPNVLKHWVGWVVGGMRSAVWKSEWCLIGRLCHLCPLFPHVLASDIDIKGCGAGWQAGVLAHGAVGAYITLACGHVGRHVCVDMGLYQCAVMGGAMAHVSGKRKGMS